MHGRAESTISATASFCPDGHSTSPPITSQSRSFDPIDEVANTLDAQGHSHAALDQREQARGLWHEALDLYRAQHRDDDAAQLQRQLDALDQPNPNYAPGQDDIS